jgi:hypothetical protein
VASATAQAEAALLSDFEDDDEDFEDDELESELFDSELFDSELDEEEADSLFLSLGRLSLR